MDGGGFIRNHWYVAATSAEVTADKPFARTLLNEPVVLFRRRDGSVAMLEDRCPHRKAPLSLGEVIGDEIQCGYHGVRLDGNGICTAIPSQRDAPIPRNFCARSFPLVEQHALIFAWMGDPAKADPALLPNWMTETNTKPGWVAVHGYHHVKGNYQLIADNLLDLTHVTYTHKTTLAGPGVNEAPMEVWVEGDVVRTQRVIRDVDPAPIHRAIKGLNGKIDRWQLSEFRPPCSILVTLAAEIAGTMERFETPTHLVIDSVTPETETTSHYFWSVSRCFETANEALSKKFLEITYTAFDEDAAIIEAQQRMISSDRSNKPLVSFLGDRAGAAARRIVARKLDEEAKAGGAKEAAE
jgi:phenylpropionate dioxygenase-like ring-hydroxylating dioxygenase large terminal subunit